MAMKITFIRYVGKGIAHSSEQNGGKGLLLEWHVKLNSGYRFSIHAASSVFANNRHN